MIFLESKLYEEENADNSHFADGNFSLGVGREGTQNMHRIVGLGLRSSISFS